MAAPTEYYVDADDGSDITGDGSSGNPWATVQFALDNITRDATNGDVIFLQGTDTILAALSLATYGVPTQDAPLYFKQWSGQTQGQINGSGTVSILNSATLDFISFVGLQLGNCGANPVVLLDDNNFFEDCEIFTTTGVGLDLNIRNEVRNCYFRNIGNAGVILDGEGNRVCDSYFENDSNDFTNAIEARGDRMVVARNIFDIDGSTNAIRLFGTNILVQHNSLLADSGTGSGIVLNAANNHQGISIVNNLIEGFSGAGGDGVDFASGTRNGNIYAGNAFFNNTSNETNKTAGEFLFENDNEDLASTPYKKTGAKSFANRFSYFEPANVGNVIGGAYPQ